MLRACCATHAPVGWAVTPAVDLREPLPPGAYVRWRYDVKNAQVRTPGVDVTDQFGELSVDGEGLMPNLKPHLWC